MCNTLWGENERFLQETQGRVNIVVATRIKVASYGRGGHHDPQVRVFTCLCMWHVIRCHLEANSKVKAVANCMICVS